MIERVDFIHGHLFAGIGGGAEGFNQGESRVGSREVRFRCAGGIDVDAGAIEAFTRRAGVPGTVLDLFSTEQYTAFHGHAPPPGWCEAVPEDIRRAFQWLPLHALFLSAPCKAFSGLLPQQRSLLPKYQALNQLSLRGLMLALEAYKDEPIPFVLFENVPRIATRGRAMVDQLVQLLHSYGYATAETTHDCGELGGLAQSRNRWLLVARHMEKVPPFLYEPDKKPLISVGRLLEKFPLPGDTRVVGPMHRVPSLQWKTWVRLAFVEAGSDWRSLQKLRVVDGALQDFGLVPERPYFADAFGVTSWDETSGTVTADARPSKGPFSVADPRVDGHHKSVQCGVRPWDEPSPTVTGKMHVGQGPFSVADPRIDGLRHNNVFRIVRWDQYSAAVTAGGHPTAGGIAVADPRTTEGPSGPHFANSYRVQPWDETARTVTTGGSPSCGAASIADPRVAYNANSHRNKLRVIDWEKRASTVTCGKQVQGGALSVADPRAPQSWPGGKYRVSAFDEPAGTVIGNSTTGNGAYAVADPRCQGEYRDNPYGVLRWDETAGTVAGCARWDNGYFNVADPRIPAADERLTCIIRALDGTWHRPFTTLELAALQGLVDPEECMLLPGKSDSQHREWIGNCVPPPAARAIASAMGQAWLLAIAGETFVLSATPVWVRPIVIALSVSRREEAAT